MKNHFITFVLVVFTCCANAQLPFSDGFESGDFIAGGWMVTGAAQVSTSSPYQGNYCAEGPATWGISKTIPSITSNHLNVEFAAKASQTNTNCLIFRIKDFPGGTSAGIFFDEFGSIIGVDGSGTGSTVPLMPYIPGTWYFFRFELDMTMYTFDVYINNILMANDFDFYSFGFTYPYLFTWSSIALSGSAWIDDVTIYETSTGTDDISNHQPVILYPNPVQSVLHISPGYASRFNFAVYDLNGKLRSEIKVNAAGEEINCSGMESGIYILRLNEINSGSCVNYKLVKQ